MLCAYHFFPVTMATPLVSMSPFPSSLGRGPLAFHSSFWTLHQALDLLNPLVLA